MITEQESQKKIEEILAKFTVGDHIDRDESIRIKKLGNDFRKALQRWKASMRSPQT